MEVSDVARLKELERENAELKKMFAEASIKVRALKNPIKKALTPELKREVIDFLTTEEQLIKREGVG